MTSKEFEQVVCGYLDGKIDQKKLTETFYWLAELVATNKKMGQFIDMDDAIQEGVLICFEKLPRYDRTKAVAFNYFTTTIMCIFAQLMPRKRNYEELKRRYYEKRKQDEREGNSGVD